MKQTLSKRRRKEAIEGFLFISPWAIGFLFLTAVPLFASLFMSFTKWDIVNPPKWVGLKNYINIFTADSSFYQSIKVTVTYALFSLPLRLVAGLTLSLMLNVKVKGIRIYRTIFYFPSVISGVAISMLWMWIFSKDFGILNRFLGFFSIQPIGWLVNPRFALSSLIIMSLWTVGSSVIMFLAGLQNISKELYEAARIDGAGKVKSFFWITLPLITPTIFFLLVTGLIESFQTFTQAYVITGGGPMKSTYFYMMHIYNEAFGRMQMGYGSALAWLLTIVILVFTMFVFRSSALWVYYEGKK